MDDSVAQKPDDTTIVNMNKTERDQNAKSSDTLSPSYVCRWSSIKSSPGFHTPDLNLTLCKYATTLPPRDMGKTHAGFKFWTFDLWRRASPVSRAWTPGPMLGFGVSGDFGNSLLTFSHLSSSHIVGEWCGWEVWSRQAGHHSPKTDCGALNLQQEHGWAMKAGH